MEHVSQSAAHMARWCWKPCMPLRHTSSVAAAASAPKHKTWFQDFSTLLSLCYRLTWTDRMLLQNWWRFFRDFLVKLNLLFLSLINSCGESSVFSFIGVFSLWLNLELMPFSWRLFFFNIPLVHLLNVQSFCKFTGVLFHCSKNLIWPLMVLFHFAESGVHTSSDWLVMHHFVN